MSNQTNKSKRKTSRKKEGKCIENTCAMKHLLKIKTYEMNFHVSVSCEKVALSAPMITISIFYIFGHSRSSLDILAKFNLLRSMERTFLDLYFCGSASAINFPCSNSWLKTGVNDVIFSKIPHGLKL